MFLLFSFFCAHGRADEPLHAIIDREIPAETPKQRSADAEFLRRIFLDLSGTIPSSQETRLFLDDPSKTKRIAIIDELLNRPTYATRMASAFHVMWMERLGDDERWTNYLNDCFAKNRPWNELAKEILRADGVEGSRFFMAKRLENYGQNPVDYSGLTRDIGRLFLGKNFQCCECHDHLTIPEYKQSHFQGLHAFIRNIYLADAKSLQVAERPTTDKLAFASVFTKVQMQTAPALPGGMMLEIPALPKGEEYLEKPDRKTKNPGIPKYRTLVSLSEAITSPQNPDFATNFVNRIWFLFMGRGLIHPLDLSHAENPASHPELLKHMTKAFIEHHYDIRWLVREIVSSQAYQRSSRNRTNQATKRYDTAFEKRLSAEQLYQSILTATGSNDEPNLKSRFLKTYMNQPREPEDEIAPSLKAALFLLNDKEFTKHLQRSPGNLIDRLAKLEKPDAIADELYVSILSRRPTPDEIQTVVDYLNPRKQSRDRALANLAWSLLASTEFGVNH